MSSGLISLLGLAPFRRDASGSVSQIFAFSLIPVLGIAGAAVDYSRASNEKARLSLALDVAMAAGARDGSAQWQTVAGAAFTTAYIPGAASSTVPTPSFSKSGNVYTGTVSTTVGTTFLANIGLAVLPISVRVSARATPGQTDTSCILLLDKGQATSHQSLSVAANVTLSGCGVRSNTSVTCSSLIPGSTDSSGVGTVSTCPNSKAGADAVTDIYSALASNITHRCSSYPGGTWSTSSTPSGSQMVTVNQGSYTEYHVCGDLKLSGNGTLSGTSSGADTVIVVENGKIKFNNNLNATAQRTTIVMTGNNSVASTITFPNGAGAAGTLTIGAPQSATNPWLGMGLYLDPSLTNGINLVWKNNNEIKTDGVIYMPNSAVTLSGDASTTSVSSCAKLVFGTLSITSSANVNLNHGTSACTTLGVKQWSSATQVAITE